MGSISLRRLALELPKISDPGCTLCPLHEYTDRVCISGNPPTQVTTTDDGSRVVLAVVGEAPGGNEERTGQLFSGAAGQLLWTELKALGFERSQFHVTNVTRCRPPENRTPHPGEIRTCVERYLESELQLLRPRYGLLLGNSGIRGVLGRSGITKHNAGVYGDARTGPSKTQWVAAFHPAAVLRNPKLIVEFRAALLKFRALIRNEEGQPVTEAIAVDNLDTLDLLIEELEKAKSGAIDIESWSSHPGHGNFKGGGLAWWHHDWRLTHINFAFNVGTAYVVPLWNKYSPWKKPQQVIDILKPLIEAVPEWYCHNGKYDIKCLARAGIFIHHSFDTMGAQYAIDENSRKDLGFMASLYLQAPNYKETINKAAMNIAKIGPATEYGARDADYTLRLTGYLRKRLREDEKLAERLYHKLLHRADLVLADVERRGLPLHRGKLDARRQINLKNMQDQEAAVRDIAGWAINVRSPAQLGKLLFDQLDLPVVERTKGGKPSTAEKSLIILRDLDETGVMDAIMEFRQWDGYRSRYFDAWSDLMDTNGRLHPSFKSYHTITGRLSAGDPNVQQIPRDTFIRGIVGGRKGWTFLEADFSQIELRLAAHYSQDRTLLRIFTSGRDPHMETAMQITGKLERDITSEERKKAKSVNFGFLYGMGWKTYIDYAKTKFGINVSIGESKQTRHAFFQTYSGLPAWHERQRKKARDRGWVISSIGRKRHLWDIASTDDKVAQEAERQAINSPVQSLASDMMLMAMCILHDMLDENVARIVSTVHDAILFEVKDEAVDDIVPIIRQVMTNLPLEEWFECRLTVPIDVEIKAGKFWSEGSTVLAR